MTEIDSDEYDVEPPRAIEVDVDIDAMVEAAEQDRFAEYCDPDEPHDDEHGVDGGSVAATLYEDARRRWDTRKGKKLWARLDDYEDIIFSLRQDGVSVKCIWETLLSKKVALPSDKIWSFQRWIETRRDKQGFPKRHYKSKQVSVLLDNGFRCVYEPTDEGMRTVLLGKGGKIISTTLTPHLKPPETQVQPAQPMTLPQARTEPSPITSTSAPNAAPMAMTPATATSPLKTVKLDLPEIKTSRERNEQIAATLNETFAN